jgi:GT2 family glycosyltransferase
VRALVAQDVKPREVIVVDQGSTPLDSALVAGADGVDVMVLRDDGVGVSRARNLALDAARCPCIAVVDDDCVPSKGWLAALTAELSCGRSPDGVCGPVFPLPSAGDRICPLSSRTSLRPADYTAGALPWAVGTGGNFAARTEMVRRLGGYDCRLGPGSRSGAAEDIDLIYRMLRSGAKIRYCPEAVVRHERVPAAVRRLSRRTYGRGMGAFIAIRGREGDLSVGLVLCRWVVQRLARLARACWRLDRLGVSEEALVLTGTARGLAIGLGLRRDGGCK